MAGCCVCVAVQLDVLLFSQIMEEVATGDLAKRGAKRPMNAFLIFCKRQRGAVREKNPHVDNRSVTRILGDLWANLDVDEKSVYTNLAKQVVFFVCCNLYKTKYKIMKKALREMQTLHAGCSKAEPKFVTPLQTPFPGVHDGQNLISRFGEDQCTQF